MATSSLPAFTMVHVTVPDKETGHSLAKSLVESQLAACVNIVPGRHDGVGFCSGSLSEACECGHASTDWRTHILCLAINPMPSACRHRVCVQVARRHQR